MEQLKLRPRLLSLAMQVQQGARLADIGTDHAKLPIFLLQRGRIASAIGSDLRQGPLAYAQSNARAYGVTLPLRLAPGLAAIAPEECDTIAIAGMGGLTIIEILQDAPWTAEGAHRLLLQPMTHIPALRQWLWAHGYQIEQEIPCVEDDRYYLTLCVRGGGEAHEVALEQCIVGSTLIAAPEAVGYLQWLAAHTKQAIQGMERAHTVNFVKLAHKKAQLSYILQALEKLS